MEEQEKKEQEQIKPVEHSDNKPSWAGSWDNIYNVWKDDIHRRGTVLTTSAQDNLTATQPGTADTFTFEYYKIPSEAIMPNGTLIVDNPTVTVTNIETSPAEVSGPQAPTASWDPVFSEEDKVEKPGKYQRKTPKNSEERGGESALTRHQRLLKQLEEEQQKMFERVGTGRDENGTPRAAPLKLHIPIPTSGSGKSGSYDTVEAIDQRNKANEASASTHTFFRHLHREFGKEKVDEYFNNWVEKEAKKRTPLPIREDEEVVLIFNELAGTLASNELKLKYGTLCNEDDHVEELAELITKYREMILKHKRKTYDEQQT